MSKTKSMPGLSPGYTAGIPEEYGKVIPSTSRAELIVFAVYMPPQAPWPGHACKTTSRLSSSLILSTAKAPENGMLACECDGDVVAKRTE
jgi:hypothetical protein